MSTVTYLNHGRVVTIVNSGYIEDRFFKEGKLNGPFLTIYKDGHYQISMWEMSVKRSQILFSQDGLALSR